MNKHIKYFFAFLTVALIVAFALPASAQRGNEILILNGPGGSYTAKLDPQGNATIDNVKPGTYSVALLVPAVQKVREAAGATNTPGKPGEIHIESWSWGTSNAKYDHKLGGGSYATPPTTTDDHNKGGGMLTIGSTDNSGKAPLPKTYDHTLGGGSLAKPTQVPPMRAPLGMKTNHGGQEYMKITLKDIMVSSVQPSSSGDPKPVESLSLNFTKITYKY